MNYTEILNKMQIQLLEPLKQVKEFHKMKCLVCNHEWLATPISKVHNFTKRGLRGCPICYSNNRNTTEKQNFLEKIKARGFAILSVYDGNQNQLDKIKVKNTTCEHEFEILPRNIIARNVNCPVCNKAEKIKRLNANSKARSVEWQKTADIWIKYRHKVTMATRSTYHKFQSTINPLNLPRGLAGQEGAYHLDHIVPVRWCFEHYVPVDICAHYTNLQMLQWNDNIGSRDNLKDGSQIPKIFEPYVHLNI